MLTSAFILIMLSEIIGINVNDEAEISLNKLNL